MSEFFIPGFDKTPLSHPDAWSYHPDQPKTTEHSKDELDKLFSTNDFPFKPADYTPGEMGYLACFGDRLLRSFQDAEAKITEDDPERELKQKGVKDLITVTRNRLVVVHRAIQARMPALHEIAYYRSRHTGQPYIDAASRVFLFVEPLALAKAAERNDTEFELASSSPQELSRILYLNGCEQLVLNDGHLAYSAKRSDILPRSSVEPAAAAVANAPASDAAATSEATPISEHNRAIRFFCLAFLQVLKSTNEGDKQKTLTMLESQISTRLLQTTMYFKAKTSEAGNTEFLVLSDGQNHTALGAFTDKSSLPQDGGLYPEMPVYYIAYQLTQSENQAENQAGNQVGGIILNPGELNFFLDKNWLTRLVRFAQKLAEAKQKKEQEKASEEPV